jgi:hypothetical protein
MEETVICPICGGKKIKNIPNAFTAQDAALKLATIPKILFRNA